jgi:hypothetical protein
MDSRFASQFMSLETRLRLSPPPQDEWAPEPDVAERAAIHALAAQRGKPAYAPPPSASRAIGALLRLLGREQAGGGLGLNELKRRWDDLAGAPFAGKILPEKLAGGVLTVSAPSALAPLLQQQAGLLMERLNMAGARIISVRIEHRARRATAAANVQPLSRPLNEAEDAALARGLEGVSDPKLRQALLRLGRAVGQD